MQIDEAILTQYALDILKPEEYRLVQQKIAASPFLRNELVSICNALQQIAYSEPVNPRNDIREMVMGSIDDQTRFSGFTRRFADLFDLDSKTSQYLLGKINKSSDQAWQSTLFPGVTIMKFPGGPLVATSICGIVQVQKGKLFPAHEHQANETNLILQGFAIDDSANVLTAGDMFRFSAGSRHSLRSIGDEPFVFAVVLEQNNKWLWGKTLVDYFKSMNI